MSRVSSFLLKAARFQHLYQQKSVMVLNFMRKQKIFGCDSLPKAGEHHGEQEAVTKRDLPIIFLVHL